MQRVLVGARRKVRRFEEEISVAMRGMFSDCCGYRYGSRSSDLIEYRAWTDSEEVHCVVSPDFLSKDIIDEVGAVNSVEKDYPESEC